MRIDVVHTWSATLDVRPQSLKLVVMDADGNELLKAIFGHDREGQDAVTSRREEIQGCAGASGR